MSSRSTVTCRLQTKISVLSSEDDETVFDPDSPFHLLGDDRFFKVDYVESLENEMTLRDLGRVRSKASRHAAYSEAILLPENLLKDVKPAYHFARVKPVKYMKKLLEKMAPKFLKKKENRFTFENVIDRKSNDSSGSSSLYPRQKRCILGRGGGDVTHFIPYSPSCRSTSTKVGDACHWRYYTLCSISDSYRPRSYRCIHRRARESISTSQ